MLGKQYERTTTKERHTIQRPFAIYTPGVTAEDFEKKQTEVRSSQPGFQPGQVDGYKAGGVYIQTRPTSSGEVT